MRNLLTGGMIVHESDTVDDLKFSDVYCGFCGSLLGQVGSPEGRAGFYCRKCREKLITTLKENRLSFEIARRDKRQVPVNA